MLKLSNSREKIVHLFIHFLYFNPWHTFLNCVRKVLYIKYQIRKKKKKNTKPLLF